MAAIGLILSVMIVDDPLLYRVEGRIGYATRLSESNYHALAG